MPSSDFSKATYIVTGTQRYRPENFLQALVAESRDLIYRIRMQPQITFEYVNAIVTALLYYQPDELYGIENALQKLTVAEDMPVLENLLKTGSKTSYTLRWYRKDGSPIWLEHSCVRVLDDEGVLVAIEGIARDISSRIIPDELNPPDGKRYAEQLALIEEIVRSLASTLSSAELFNRLGQAILRFFQDVSTIYISKYDPVRQEITCVFALQDQEVLDTTLFPTIPLSPPGKGMQSEAIRSGKPLVIADLLESHPTKITYIGSGGPVSRSAVYMPMIFQNQVTGVLQLQSCTVGRFTNNDVQMLNWLAETAAVTYQNSLLFENLNKSRQDLEMAYNATLEGWVRALELRDRETLGHTRRVVWMTTELGKALGLTQDELRILEQGALLHDIGKMGIPDHILLKPGKLSEEEWQEMQLHPQYAYEMLSPIHHLLPALDIPYCHHEKWDGSGYPRKLKGLAIPLSARLFSIIDVWDALCSSRPYRPAWDISRAREYLIEQSEKQFDPAIIPVFLELLKEHSELFIDPYV